MKSILFICKQNHSYGHGSYTRKSSGLYNSTRFIVEAIDKPFKINASLVEILDNNDIDRVVTIYRPHIVVLEALWCVPSKFEILKKLHPKVKWFVHLHSHIPFLASEGIAMEWIDEYLRLGVGVITNSKPAYKSLSAIFKSKKLIYLPNVYIPAKSHRYFKHRHSREYVDIACFGAIRPLKNQLLQAMAAIKFARQIGRKLNFHINATRVETNGDPVLKNLRELFKRTSGTFLIEHHWMDPEALIHVLQHGIDVGMQVSLSETFNVVSADYVTASLPVVVSKEVSWLSFLSKAKDDSINSMVFKLHLAYRLRFITRLNRFLLDLFAKKAIKAWIKFGTMA